MWRDAAAALAGSLLLFSPCSFAECRYDDFTIETWLEGANGGWISHDGSEIVYNRVIHGRSDVWVAGFDPAGPVGETCLTCSASTGQSWGMEWQSQHPNGWVLFHSDRDHTPLSAGPAGGGPGGEIYALHRSDPSTHYRLTFSNRPATAFGGSFSPDGTKVLYTTTTSARWDVVVADFLVDGDGVPSLDVANARHFVHPEDATGTAWYETQGWSHDGSELLVTSTATSSMNLELYRVNVTTGSWRRMTDSWAWEEQSEINPVDDTVFAINSTRDRTDPYNLTLYLGHLLGVPSTADAGLVAASLGGLLLPHPDYRFAPDVYVYTDDGESGPIRISRDGAEGRICVPRSWTPDGKILVFSNQWQDIDREWRENGYPSKTPRSQWRIRLARFACE